MSGMRLPTTDSKRRPTERPDRAAHPERTERAERAECPERGHVAARAERPERAEAGDLTARTEPGHVAARTEPGDLAARSRAAAALAARYAAEVDAEGRFPREALAELRRRRLLGVLVPESLSGEGARLAEVVDCCYVLGQACASTALIFAMHQIKIACLVRHHRGDPTISGILRRIAAEQLLLASSTTEGTAGGNVRSSDAAIERAGEVITLDRQATVMSYATEADGIVTTARRSREASASDQVLVVLLKPDYTLERLQTWDTLGMRGTRSEGFALHARASAEQVLADPYEKIHAQTMVPHAHLLWGAVWAGIATAATAKAQAFTRNAARRAGGQTPPGASHLTQCIASLRTLRGGLQAALRSYESVQADAATLRSLEFQSMMTSTKIETSELAVSIVLGALRACGLTGYRNDTEFSIGRHLRDVLSAPLMINNDRILADLAATSLLAPLPTSIVA